MGKKCVAYRKGFVLVATIMFFVTSYVFPERPCYRQDMKIEMGIECAAYCGVQSPCISCVILWGCWCENPGSSWTCICAYFCECPDGWVSEQREMYFDSTYCGLPN